MLDLRQTPEYAKYMENIGWTVERESNINYFIKKFPVIGSFIKIQRPEKIDFNRINRIAKKYRSFQIVVEPKNANDVSRLASHGYKQSKSPYLPPKTIHVDLAKTQARLLKEMHYKTRYNIKKAISNKLKVISTQDIKAFANFWQECALKQRGMFLSQKKEIIELYKTFGKNAYILVVHLNAPEVKNSIYLRDQILAGVLMVCTKDIAYYMYAASTDLGKKLFAPTINIWESIKLAKKLGCKIFDFEGIYDERFPLASWKGFTRFKKSFGGKEIEYPGAYTKFRIPL